MLGYQKSPWLLHLEDLEELRAKPHEGTGAGSLVDSEAADAGADGLAGSGGRWRGFHGRRQRGGPADLCGEDPGGAHAMLCPWRAAPGSTW
jgi:hypothetical protein